jgi:hypothetical protein
LSRCSSPWRGTVSSRVHEGRGYELAREPRHITADEILRAADTADKTDRTPVSHPLLSRVVMPAVEQAERIFCTALTRINIEDLAHSAASLPTQEQDRPDSIVTEPDSVKQSRARDRRVVLTKIGRRLRDQHNTLATPVPPHLDEGVEKLKTQK